eukprot:gene5264-5312_t
MGSGPSKLDRAHAPSLACADSEPRPLAESLRTVLCEVPGMESVVETQADAHSMGSSTSSSLGDSVVQDIDSGALFKMGDLWSGRLALVFLVPDFTWTYARYQAKLISEYAVRLVKRGFVLMAVGLGEVK